MTKTTALVELKNVTGAPTHIMKSFHRLVDLHRSGGREALENNFENIGQGACGAVYALSDEYVVKVAFNNSQMSREAKDGEVLEALQGLPLVPTLYSYSLDNKYMLIQRIQGENICYLYRSEIEIDSFDRVHWFNLCKEFYEGSRARGWIPNDLHSENVMLDYTGSFWVIDFGLFKQSERDTFGGDVLEELESHCESISYYAKSRKEKEARKLVREKELKQYSLGFITF